MDLITPAPTTPIGGFPTTTTPLIAPRVTTYPPAPTDFTPFTTCVAVYSKSYDPEWIDRVIFDTPYATCLRITHPLQIQTLPPPAPKYSADCSFYLIEPTTVTIYGRFTPGTVLTLVETLTHPKALSQTPPPSVTTLTALETVYESVLPGYIRTSCTAKLTASLTPTALSPSDWDWYGDYHGGDIPTSDSYCAPVSALAWTSLIITFFTIHLS
ncbi:hypothetical protein VTJ04DRAFT_9640 [Mycothermus thermophilus]|uniref:uncharacterized protein n=1 Tax=Humicola insolens TaxID=85995 RepID=UPI003743D328